MIHGIQSWPFTPAFLLSQSPGLTPCYMGSGAGESYSVSPQTVVLGETLQEEGELLPKTYGEQTVHAKMEGA